jgi:hypothetical protein
VTTHPLIGAQLHRLLIGEKTLLVRKLTDANQKSLRRKLKLKRAQMGLARSVLMTN